MSTVFITGLGMGLGAAVPIGPVNVEIARRTLRGGYWRGVALGCGAVTVDITYAVLTSLGMAPLTRFPFVFWIMLAGGMGVLIYLGVMSLVGALRSIRLPSNDDDESTPLTSTLFSGYLTGVAMTALNPFTVAFWFLTLPAVASNGYQRTASDLPILCLGVFGATIAWVLGFAGILAWLGQFQKRRWIFVADLVGGIMLLVLAMITLVRAF